MTQRQHEDDDETTALRRAVSGKLLFVFILGDVLGARSRCAPTW